MNATAIGNVKRIAGGRGLLAVHTLAALLTSGAVSQAHAATLYWSGDGSSLGGNGTWDTSNARWGTATTGPFATVWNNANKDTAEFRTPGGTITVSQSIEASTVYFASGNYTLSGAGALTLHSNENSSRGLWVGTATSQNTISVPITLAANSGFYVQGTGNGITINQPISGSYQISKSGVGFLALNASNTFTGGISHSQGTLRIGHDHALGTGTLVFGSGTWETDAARTFTNAITTATSSPTVTFGGTHAMTFSGNYAYTTGTGGDRTLTLAVNTADGVTFNGRIYEADAHARVLNINKTGSSTLVLGGDNAYDGTTTVPEGTLRINGNQAGATGNVSVASGATLGGNGSVGGSVSVPSGATLAARIDGAAADELKIVGTGKTLTLAGYLDVIHVGAPSANKYRIATASSIDITGVTVTGQTAWTPELRNGNTELWITGGGGSKGTLIAIR